MHLEPYASSSVTHRRMLAGALTLSGLGVAAWVHADLPTPACPFRYLTGIDCPGCGSARAADALLRGDIAAMADHNLLFLPALLVAAVAVLRLVRTRPHRAGDPVRGRVRFQPARVAMAVIGTFWVLRVIPFGPFDYLAA